MNKYAAGKGTKQEDGISLYAIVGPDSLNNAKYRFQMGGWWAEEYLPLRIRFRYTLPLDFEEADVYRAAHDLENILLSMFVSDYIPRRILHFDHERTLEEERALQLMTIFGQCGDPFDSEKETVIKCIAQRGIPFPTDWHLDIVPSTDSIEEWFKLFSKNPSVAAGVGLIQESFAAINQFAGTHRYHNYLELSKAIILMTSGLESLFFKNSEDHKTDISFKFRLIGAIFYEKYVTEEFLSKVYRLKKFSFVEIRLILGAIYDIRSVIAHGKAQDVFRKPNQLNKWKKLFKIMRITQQPDMGMFFRNIVLFMSLLQPHLLALIICSKHELSKGAQIVDEIFASEERKNPGSS
jgi:hypothetical protein